VSFPRKRESRVAGAGVCRRGFPLSRE
jgi:hypothetical protein